MTEIPQSLVDDYRAALKELTSRGRSDLAKALRQVDFDDIAKARDQTALILNAYGEVYGDAAAVASARFYDDVRKLATGNALGALAENGRDSRATTGAVRAFAGDPTTAASKAVDRLDYEIRKSAFSCIHLNGRRDPKHVRYARVPSGADTCAFCIMLASRGAVYKDSESAGHCHAHCDCVVVPDFGGGTQIGGYDPAALYETYRTLRKGGERR